MNSSVIQLSKPPHYTEGWAFKQRSREAEKGKQKERIKHERASCCSIEPCLTGTAQEVWVTLSKINTAANQLPEWTDGWATDQKAGRRKVDLCNTWWDQQARRWDESEAKCDFPLFWFFFKYHLFFMCCPWSFHLSSNRPPPLPFSSLYIGCV